jgi:hypothetical protein
MTVMDNTATPICSGNRTLPKIPKPYRKVTIRYAKTIQSSKWSEFLNGAEGGAEKIAYDISEILKVELVKTSFYSALAALLCT